MRAGDGIEVSTYKIWNYIKKTIPFALSPVPGLTLSKCDSFDIHRPPFDKLRASGFKVTAFWPAGVISLFFLFTFVHRGSAQNLTLLYTNDLHAQYIPLKSGNSQTGGMEALYELVQRERNDHTLLLDGGDHETGTLLSILSVDGVRGGGMIRMMNLIGFRASVIGNHEFDNGWQNLKRMQDLAGFDMLSANLFREGKLFAGKAYAIHAVNGLEVGVIGLSSEDLYSLTYPPNLDRIKIEKVIPTARKIVRMIDPVTDLIVLLTHQGFEMDSLLALAVPQADVIVGGHSHTVLGHPRLVNGVIIVQAGSRSQNLGRLDLSLLNDRVASFTGRLIPVRHVRIPKKSAMKPLVKQYREQIERQYGKVIGDLEISWEISKQEESNVGDFFTDVMRAAAGAEFAVINSGGIRRGMQKGPIREMDIREIFPFENRLVRFSCTGRELRKLIGTNAAGSFKKSQGILQISGLRYAARWNGKGVEILEATVDGKPIRNDGIYSGVTVDYVVPYNAGQYLGFSPKAPETLDTFLIDEVLLHIRKNPKVRARVEGRMRHVR
jgi:5'-nucleotidase / UDP-sugar diphosphatase